MMRRPLASLWLGRAHQGGWDEVLMIFGLPLVFFIVMRWIAGRRGADDEQDGAD